MRLDFKFQKMYCLNEVCLKGNTVAYHHQSIEYFLHRTTVMYNQGIQSYLLVHVIPRYHYYTHKLWDQGWKGISEGSALLHTNSCAVQLETEVHSETIHISHHLKLLHIHCSLLCSKAHFSFTRGKRDECWNKNLDLFTNWTLSAETWILYSTHKTTIHISGFCMT